MGSSRSVEEHHGNNSVGDAAAPASTSTPAPQTYLHEVMSMCCRGVFAETTMKFNKNQPRERERIKQQKGDFSGLFFVCLAWNVIIMIPGLWIVSIFGIVACVLILILMMVVLFLPSGVANQPCASGASGTSGSTGTSPPTGCHDRPFM